MRAHQNVQPRPSHIFRIKFESLLKATAIGNASFVVKDCSRDEAHIQRDVSVTDLHIVTAVKGYAYFKVTSDSSDTSTGASMIAALLNHLHWSSMILCRRLHTTDI